MTRGGWVQSITLSAKQQAVLRRELGAAADEFIAGAEAALKWYSVTVAARREGESATVIRQRISAVSLAAKALATALDALGPHSADILGVMLQRHGRRPLSLLATDLRHLGGDADAAAPRPPRGGPTSAAQHILVRQLASHYSNATGRKPGKTEGGPFARAIFPVLQAARIPTTSTRRLIRTALST